jgi:hypothetical protein
MNNKYYKSKIFIFSSILFFIICEINAFKQIVRYSVAETAKTSILLAVISFIFGLSIWFLYKSKLNILAISVMAGVLFSLIRATMFWWPQHLNGHYNQSGAAALGAYSILGITLGIILEGIYRELCSRDNIIRKIIISVLIVIVGIYSWFHFSPLPYLI